MHNAACYQYGIDCPPPLPYTGFHVMDAILIGLLVLGLGLVIRAELSRRK